MSPPSVLRRRRACLPALLAVLALAGCGGDPGGTSTAGRSTAAADVAPGTRCNGAVFNCSRRLDQVVFPGTHNSYAAATEPGWHFADQNYPIARQLDDGIRALLIDVHFGVADPARGIVLTDLGAEGAERNKVAAVLPPQALRLARRLAGTQRIGAPKGTSTPYLCHTLCELGAEPLDAELAVIRRFLDGHPHEVLQVIVEDYVRPPVIEAAFRRAGLLGMVATLDRAAPLPSLGALIASGHRLVVFAEDDGGTPAWYMKAFSFIQDTPLGALRPSSLSCALARGSADNPILLMNHWLDVFPPSPTLEAQIGRATFLRRRVAQCTRERGRRPGIIAVDFHDAGAVVAVARSLNAAR